VGVRSRRRFATPADFPPHDGSPYRGLRVRRWDLGFVPRSRTMPNPAVTIRSGCIAVRQVLWQRVRLVDGVPQATTVSGKTGELRLRLTNQDVGFSMRAVVAAVTDLALGPTVVRPSSSPATKGEV
jgi:hypothetical protein